MLESSHKLNIVNVWISVQETMGFLAKKQKVAHC